VHPQLGARRAIDHYVRYYKCVEPVADQVVVAEFWQIIENFPRVMQRLNARYATSFGCFDTTDEHNRKVLLEAIEKRHKTLRQPAELLPIPSGRQTLDSAHRLALDQEPSMREARALYARLLAFVND
jgi:hypothetical protein